LGPGAAACPATAAVQPRAAPVTVAVASDPGAIACPAAAAADPGAVACPAAAAAEPGAARRQRRAADWIGAVAGAWARTATSAPRNAEPVPTRSPRPSPAAAGLSARRTRPLLSWPSQRRRSPPKAVRWSAGWPAPTAVSRRSQSAGQSRSRCRPPGSYADLTRSAHRLMTRGSAAPGSTALSERSAAARA